MGLFDKLLNRNQCTKEELNAKELNSLFLDQLFDTLSDRDNMECSLGVLSEKDFYPPEDNRILHSRLCGIDETNNFNQFTKDFFELCDEEEIYD